MFTFSLSLDAAVMTGSFSVRFVPISRTIRRDVDVFSSGDPLRLVVTRIPSSWSSLNIPVCNELPLSGGGMLTSFDTSVLFCCVTPDLCVFDYGPEDTFYLVAAPLVGGTRLCFLLCLPPSILRRRKQSTGPR
jgi:hypothetical protein